MAVREDGDALVYEARPSRQAGAVFRSTAIGATSVVFENPQHDFPRAIGYQLAAPDSLLAWIEGPRDGRTRRIEFRSSRVACAGG
jgi:hypothetical protein